MTPEEAHRILTTCHSNPEFFVREVLGDDPWAVPCQIMRAISRTRARVAVKACHASGKTWTLARIVLWWTCSGGVTVTTAPTWTQVKRQLWGEVHQAYRNARMPLGGTLNQTELQIGPNAYAIGLSTNEGVNFQGFHGRILIIEDEAPGIETDIVAAIDGIRAGGDVRVLAAGNPVIASGPFYDAFEAPRSAWQCFTIDAFDTPNLIGTTVEDFRAIAKDDVDNPFLAYSPRPYLTTRAWVHERLYEWGEDSPQWQSRVRGEFPDESEDQLLSRRWITEARNRAVVATGECVAGLDVAGPGEDETVLTVRIGPRIVAMQAWSKPDPRGEVVAALAPYKQRKITVNVDVIGIGYYMAQHLKDHGFNVVAVNVGAKPRDDEKYRNLKAELYWGLRLRFQEGSIGGAIDDDAARQLLSIRYEHNARGQIEIESKEDARTRGVHSPDRAESIMLAFAVLGRPFAVAQGGTRQGVTLGQIR